MKTAYDVILAPVLSEKAYAGFAEGKYTFWAVSYTHLTLPTILRV